MKYFIAVMMICAINRCHASELAYEEIAFQALHAVDLQQTIYRDHNPCIRGKCYGESSSVFDAGWIIGRYPSDKAVYSYFAAEAVVHAAVSYMLRGHPWAYRTWEAVTIGMQGATVGSNFSVGIGVRF